MNFTVVESLFWLCLFAAPLGSFIVFRKMSFVGDALSHSTLGGVAIAHLYYGHEFLPLSIGALISALTASFLLNFFERRWNVSPDIALTVSYTSLFALGMMLLSEHGEELVHMLMGDISSIDSRELWSMRIWSFIVIAVLLIFWKPLWLSVIDSQLARSLGYSVRWTDRLLVMLVAVSVVGLMQTVGLILVSSYLILPAASVLPWVRSLKAMFMGSILSAMLSSALGLVVLHFKPSLSLGPTLALSAFAIFAISHAVRYTEILRGLWESSKSA